MSPACWCCKAEKLQLSPDIAQMLLVSCNSSAGPQSMSIFLGCWCTTKTLLQGAPRRPYIGYPAPGMFMGYGMDMGPYRGRGRGQMQPMHPAAGRFAQPAYGYGYGYGYFPPPFAQPFPGRMPPNAGRMGGRGFIGERRPPPGTPGVSSGLQVK